MPGAQSPSASVLAWCTTPGCTTGKADISVLAKQRHFPLLSRWLLLSSLLVQWLSPHSLPAPWPLGLLEACWGWMLETEHRLLFPHQLLFLTLLSPRQAQQSGKQDEQPPLGSIFTSQRASSLSTPSRSTVKSFIPPKLLRTIGLNCPRTGH